MSFKIILFLIGLTFYTTEAEKVAFADNPFLGTWEYRSANTAFIVSVWTDEQGVTKGHYKKIVVDSNGDQIATLYNSKKFMGTSTTYWPYALYFGNYQGGFLEGGNIIDNTVINERGFRDGQFIFTINNTTIPLTAHWEVKKKPDEMGIGDPDFYIPTDLILTKVGNFINPD